MAQRRAESLEREVDHRRRVERQRLAEDQAADDRDPERAPELGADAAPERERQASEEPPSSAYRIGRKRSEAGL
jgi:hypothetical protein